MDNLPILYPLWAHLFTVFLSMSPKDGTVIKIRNPKIGNPIFWLSYFWDFQSVLHFLSCRNACLEVDYKSLLFLVFFFKGLAVSGLQIREEPIFLQFILGSSLIWITWWRACSRANNPPIPPEVRDGQQN